MLIRPSRPWNMPEKLTTPEHVVLNRRAVLRGGAAIAAGAVSTSAHASWLFGGTDEEGVKATLEAVKSDPSAGLYPAMANPGFKDAGRMPTPELINASYNNYYEFGSSKNIYDKAQAINTRPWVIAIDGLVEEPMTIDIDDLLNKVALEERVYRHRCVEAWAMVVPWTGFPLKSLVEIARPLGSAKYLRFETFLDAAVSPEQARGFGYPWPYVEGVTISEATSELAFLATGAYGKPLAKQFGAPIRLHLPWKYGFKSIKSLVRVSFVEERPVGFWETLQASEYGFWANVNPEVSHPRWSQANERVLGTDESQPTRLFNGYGEWVGDLYKGLESERLFT
ncbi:MAG: protein-methionine-sulfoxide reductase catalytic subunit MsrP [Hyphomicrobiaceae bacterium]